MTITSSGRRARSAMALVAGAALLSLTACGTDTGGEAEEPSAAPASDGGTQGQSPQEPTSSDGGGAGEDESVTSAAGDRTRIMLRTELGVDGSTGEGPLALADDELAALLAESFGGDAECDDELMLEPGADAVDCVGPANWDDPAEQQDWVANVVLVPQESGFQNGSRVAVLFSTGSALPEAASSLLDEDVTVTGVGFGSAFGMEPLSAEQVAESTLGTLTSEFAYVPVDQMADWSEVTCEEGLDFTVFETVDCEATTADGTTWDLVVAPGTYADNDQGLLVGIESQRNG